VFKKSVIRGPGVSEIAASHANQRSVVKKYQSMHSILQKSLLLTPIDEAILQISKKAQHPPDAIRL
jgi:hypothetical protein